MKTLVILICFEVSFCHSDLQLTFEEHNIWSNLSDCLCYIFRTFLPETKKVLIRHDFEHNEVLSDVAKCTKAPIIINAEEILLRRGLEKRKPIEVGILINEPFNVSHTLNRTLWTADTKFFSVIWDSLNSEEEMKNHIQEFWSFGVVNLFILLMKLEDIYIYTYEPYFSGCVPSSPLLSEVWSLGRFKYGKMKSLIQKTGVVNLNGCAINVTVVDLPPTVIFLKQKDRNGTSLIDGIEGRSLIEISKKMNFKPRFAVPRDGEAWGWIEPDPRGCVGEVFTGKSQFGFGLLASTLERYEYLDMSSTPSPVRECITWAVPVGAGKQQSVWLRLLLSEFNRYIWFGIASATISVFITFRIFPRFASVKERQYGMLYVFSTSLGISVKTPAWSPLRVLFLCWIWYNFVLMTAYQSSMGSKLTVPIARRDVNTFRELLDSGLHLTGFYNTFRLVKNIDQEGDIKEISDRLEATKYGIAEAVRRITTDRNIAYMRESTTFMYQAMIDPHAKGYVHIMKQCVYIYYSSMVLKKRSPLTKKVNEVIQELFEGGISRKWRREFLYPVPLPPPGVTKLSLRHLLGPFIVLGVGIALSFVLFIAELIYYYKFFSLATSIIKPKTVTDT